MLVFLRILNSRYLDEVADDFSTILGADAIEYFLYRPKGRMVESLRECDNVGR